jgi:hypothetical protein
MPLRIDHSSNRPLDSIQIFGINFADKCLKITEFVNERMVVYTMLQREKASISVCEFQCINSQADR